MERWTLPRTACRLRNMTAQVGGGQVDLGGAIAYKPSVQFNVAAKGKSVRIRYPEGLRTVLDTNLAFTGTTQASILSGRVLIDSLSFTPDFDLARLGDQFSTGNTPSQPGFAETVRLAINVQTQSSLNAVSSQVSVAGQANLQVGGTADQPRHHWPHHPHLGRTLLPQRALQIAARRDHLR